MDIKIPVISNVVALVLLLAGAFTPGWLVFNLAKGSTIHVGLFYVAGLYTSRSITSVAFLEFQIEVIIGLVLCFLATILTFLYRTGQRGHSFLLLPILFNLISGIFTWITVGRFLHVLLQLDNLYNMDMVVPYSLILSGLGGLLCFIIVIILFMKKQQDSNLAAPASSSGVVFSNGGQPHLNLGYGIHELPPKTGY